jgi:hypothetical protein
MVSHWEAMGFRSICSQYYADPFSVENGSSLFIRRLLASSHDPFSVETGSSLFIRRLLACSHGPFFVETGSSLFIRRLRSTKTFENNK